MTTSAPDRAPDTAPLLDLNGPCATIRLNRPSQHNRIDPTDIPVIQGYLDTIEATPAIRVVVFAGNGPKTFSSGYTLQAIREKLDERTFEALLDRIERLPLPTVAAIHGGVYGGATDLALCCDLRLGVTTSRMFMPAAKFGLHYYPGGMRRYVERLGLTAATRLFLTAATIDSDEMLRIGFLTERVTPETFEARLMQVVAELAANEPGAMAAMKQSLAELGAARADTGPIERRYLDSLASPALRDRLREKLAGR
ncbi:MAG: enoyl-CoA hydratase/isomerase family protein [Burkholderiales bacterium]|nr:enoyl-CoA hydratase/isomerase family protein [Burkholderiales bacterium]